jgi:glycosyltransferase involved in cell wall biosynthesis
MKAMCRPVWGDVVEAWPVGIDTETWRPSATDEKTFDLLLYDKRLWNREESAIQLVEPIREVLRNAGLSFREIRYGCYDELEFLTLLAQCRAMIFLCEHETQGIAYQQALSCGVPIFAWDQGGPWRDPSYFPDRVLFQPVSSVPYWDDRCGLRFSDASEFAARFLDFWSAVRQHEFRPRGYIMENLTLEKCAQHYCAFAEDVAGKLALL